MIVAEGGGSKNRIRNSSSHPTHQEHSRRFLDGVDQVGREVVTERRADSSVELVPQRIVGHVLLDYIEPVTHRASTLRVAPWDSSVPAETAT